MTQQTHQKLEVAPHDLDSERSILGNAMMNEECKQVALTLLPACYYQDAHKWIARAIASVKVVSPETVATFLHDCNRLQQVGGSAYLADLAFHVPTTTKDVVLECVESVRSKWRQRLAMNEAVTIAAQARLGNVDDPIAAFRSALQRLELVDGFAVRRIVPESTMQIFERLPKVNWLCSGLQLAPGRPNLIAGPNFGGKSIFASSIAFSVASGLPVWGKHPVRCGKALHLNWDQGSYVPKRRYQRFLASAMMSPQDLEGRLQLLTRPDFRLQDGDAFNVLMQLCTGVDFIVIDSLRAALGTQIDENDSRVRDSLDMMTDVSEKTQCTFLIVHHSRKSSFNGVGQRIAVTKEDMRGSGAIADACESIYMLDPHKGKPSSVVHEKAGITGRCLPTFEVEILDQDIDGQKHAGLCVLAADVEQPDWAGEAEQRKAEREAKAKAKATKEAEAEAELILSLVPEEPATISHDALTQACRAAGMKWSRDALRTRTAYLSSSAGGFRIFDLSEGGKAKPRQWARPKAIQPDKENSEP